MGRHRTQQEKHELGERARAMRAEGRSRREIIAELRVGDDLLSRLLADTAVPRSLRRPNAKDDVRAQAVELRRSGATYDQIAGQLGVSKSTCSLWLRDEVRPEADPERRVAADLRRTAALRTRVRRDRDARDERGRQVSAAAARVLGSISSRELVIALAVSYWCEGGKAKPWNRQKAVRWMNSDPVLVGLFLEGLQLLGIGHDRLTLRVHVHETADEVAVREWWSRRTGIAMDRFARSTIKRHNPKTNRKNMLDGYRGCLSVRVQQSRELYEVLDGLVQGLSDGPRVLDRWQSGRTGHPPVGHSECP